MFVVFECCVDGCLEVLDGCEFLNFVVVDVNFG